MSATIAITVYRRRRREPLRLSPLLRFALSTAQPDPDGKPILLPEQIPTSCCGKGFKCKRVVGWVMFDGVNGAYLCREHLDRYLESPMYTVSQRVEQI
jgi:hypothetical protein